MNLSKLIRALLLLSGLILAGLNVAGLFISLRNPHIYKEQSNHYQNDISLSEAEVLALASIKESTDEAFVVKMNDAVNRGVAHYWKSEGTKSYHLRVPVYENYLLFCASFVYPPVYRKYEFNNYFKALERGVGLCSQHAIILSGLLEKKQISTKIIGLSGHVVLTAQIDRHKNKWYVCDPDAGIIVKNDIEHIQQNPEIVKPYYPEGFRVEQYQKKICVSNSIRDYHGKLHYYIEKYSYVFIWIIPVCMLAAAGWGRRQ